MGRQNLEIPPGAAHYRVSDSYVLPVDAEVQAIQPHAHYRAREMTAWATLAGGARVPLIRIENWDFNWQDQYRYVAPFWLPAGTRLEMEYVFDNSAANLRNPDRPPTRVSWGWRSSDEMADVWIQVMTRSEQDRAQLARDVRHKMAVEDAIGCEVLITRNPDHVDLRNDAGLLCLELGRPDEAIRHFEVVSRLEPQSALARYNAGVALEAAGRASDAAGRYEEALRLYPMYSLAQNNLGAVLLVSGDGGASIPHLQHAVRLRPSYPEAHFNLARAYASARRFEDAVRTATIAEAQAIAAGKIELTAQIREQLHSYREGRVKE